MFKDDPLWTEKEYEEIHFLQESASYREEYERWLDSLGGAEGEAVKDGGTRILIGLA
jgi:hypothetical protein